MVISRFEGEGGITILRISGKLIASNLDNLKSSLDAALCKEGHKAVLNMREVSIMDSVAAGLLASRRKASAKKNGAVMFCKLQPAIRELLVQSSGDESFVSCDTEDEAIASLRLSPKASSHSS